MVLGDLVRPDNEPSRFLSFFCFLYNLGASVSLSLLEAGQSNVMMRIMKRRFWHSEYLALITPCSAHISINLYFSNAYCLDRILLTGGFRKMWVLYIVSTKLRLGSNSQPPDYGSDALTKCPHCPESRHEINILKTKSDYSMPRH